MTIIELEGAYNVRDVGGLPASGRRRLRPALLYRGDSLDAITGRDQDLLFRQLRIGAVIDLRARQEIGPASWRDTFDHYHRLPVIRDDLIGTSPMPQADPRALADVYLKDLRGGAHVVAAIADLLADYLDNRIPCIIHCAAGRDRTGVIIAVLLAALGVPDADITRDYVLSNHHAGEVERRLAANPLYANGRIAGPELALARAETMTTFLELLRRSAGSAAQFLLTAGLAAASMTRLAAALVDQPRPAGQVGR